MSTPKEKFALRVLELNDHITVLMDALPELDGSYFDNGWNSGGVDPIIDPNISSLQITASQVASFITLAQQLKNFFNNAAVTQADYGATVNVLRHGGA